MCCISHTSKQKQLAFYHTDGGEPGKRERKIHTHTHSKFLVQTLDSHTSFAACCQLNLIHFGLEITTVPRKMNQSIVLPSHLYTQRRRSLVNSLHNARIKCQPKSMPACLAYWTWMPVRISINTYTYAYSNVFRRRKNNERDWEERKASERSVKLYENTLVNEHSCDWNRYRHTNAERASA